jgi:DNA-binding NtrC family response regulator
MSSLIARDSSLENGRAGFTPPNQFSGESLEQLERRHILDTLKQTNGNQTRAAKVLGISDRTLREKIRKFKQQGTFTAEPLQAAENKLKINSANSAVSNKVELQPV